MRCRSLGSTGTKVSVISLGGWTTYGDSVTDADLVARIMATAFENGINFFDSADVYARGAAERLMGAGLRPFPRQRLVIASKVYGAMSDDPNDQGLSRKHIIESIDKSLERLGTPYLDLYYCHRFDPHTPLEETVRAMDDLVRRGKIMHWGTSEWTGAQIAEAVNLAWAHNLHPPKVEQSGYSLARRARVEGEILDAARPYGIGIVAFSPLANGVLTGKYDEGIPAGTRLAQQEGAKDRYPAEVYERVRRLKPVAEGLGIDRAQLAIAWNLRHAQVSSVLMGATRPEQIVDNVKAAEVDLDASTLERIEALWPRG